jgi:hypothetical protein
MPSGSWAGHAQYGCRWCAYDALDPNGAAAIDAHEQDRHPDEYLEALGVTKTPPAPVSAPSLSPAPDLPAHEE